MKRPVVVCISAVFLIGCFLAATQKSQRISLRKDEGRPSFPFELKSEQRHCCIGGPTWTAVIILPEQYFNRQNLDCLFRFYSRQHPDRQERLIVDLFARAETTGTDPASTQSKTSAPNAVFRRQGDGAASGGGDNEWYIYAPDLNEPQQKQTVVLKGGRGFAPKKVLEIWESKVGSVELRLLSYELENAEPHGVYYTLETREAQADGWAGVMTTRLDEKISLPTENLHITNNRVAFFFLGNMYVVTTDAGKTWARWDGEDEISPSGHIERVDLDDNGRGFIIYRVNGIEPQPPTQLYTIDFGQHWANK